MTDAIAQAVQRLRDGRLVAFATETVYGLGADAGNPAAVARIFEAKGRPSTNPLIVHVTGASAARRYAAAWPAAAESLATRFWPGPLTLVLPRAGAIAPAVSAGRGTVALRAPRHPLAQQLLQAFDGPIAAPSANRSTRVSPTTADHVRQELGDRVDLILDGGPCAVGIESTVLDLTTAPPTILRPGSISAEQLRAVIGPVQTFHGSIAANVAAASPGQQAIHYSPLTPAYRFGPAQADRVIDLAASRFAASAALLLQDAPPGLKNFPWRAQRTLPLDPRQYAQMLYAALRGFDELSADAIFIQMPPDEPAWNAVVDRLMRAARPVEDA